jgi:prophage tail gpP-like protein
MLENLFGKDPDDFTLVIEDREMVITSARLMRTMDTGADAITASMAWEPGLDEKIDEITSPFSFSECAAYLGGELQSTGLLYNIDQIIEQNGSSKNLEIFTKTADIIDSTLVPPYEANNISLTDRCIQQCQPFGIDVVLGDGVNLLQKRRMLTGGTVKTRKEMSADFVGSAALNDILPINADYKTIETKGTYKVTGESIVREEQKFARVSGKQTDKIFAHLQKLAAQRGLLLSCTKYGDLLITKANTESETVGTIDEFNPMAESYKASYKGRNRFTLYRSLASSSKSDKTGQASIASDDKVLTPRVLTFSGSNNLPGEALSAADWRKNKSAADAMTLPFPVNTWYAPNGKLWEPNTTVTIINPVIGEKGFTFLIVKVEFIFDVNGVSANLNLKPPTVYTTGQIEEPWIWE